jgi:glycerol uptake facilitator protein
LENGVVANVVLARTKGHGSGWIVITAGWAFAVFIGAFCSAAASGAHLNPAVTVAMAAAGQLAMAKVAGYLGAQMLGGILGGALVYFYYREHFKASTDANDKLAVSAQRRTFVICLSVLLRGRRDVLPCPAYFPDDSGKHETPGVESAEVGLGSIGLIPVALLVFAIGLSLGVRQDTPSILPATLARGSPTPSCPCPRNAMLTGDIPGSLFLVRSLATTGGPGPRSFKITGWSKFGGLSED